MQLVPMLALSFLIAVALRVVIHAFTRTRFKVKPIEANALKPQGQQSTTFTIVGSLSVLREAMGTKSDPQILTQISDGVREMMTAMLERIGENPQALDGMFSIRVYISFQNSDELVSEISARTPKADQILRRMAKALEEIKRERSRLEGSLRLN